MRTARTNSRTNIMNHFPSSKPKQTFYYMKQMQFVVGGYHAYSIVDDPNFKAMQASLDATITTGTRQHFATEITNKAAYGRVMMKDLLKGVYYAMTTDHWTSIANDNFIAATAHFIDDDWNLKSATLCCSHHQGTQTAGDIVECLRVARQRYDLPEELLVATVTDTAANMNATGELLNTPHHYCADHVLELITKMVNA